MLTVLVLQLSERVITGYVDAADVVCRDDIIFCKAVDVILRLLLFYAFKSLSGVYRIQCPVHYDVDQKRKEKRYRT